LTTNATMLEHQLFNRIASGVLLPWAVYDFFLVRKVTDSHYIRCLLIM